MIPTLPITFVQARQGPMEAEHHDRNQGNAVEHTSLQKIPGALCEQKRSHPAQHPLLQATSDMNQPLPHSTRTTRLSARELTFEVLQCIVQVLALIFLVSLECI